MVSETMQPLVGSFMSAGFTAAARRSDDARRRRRAAGDDLHGSLLALMRLMIRRDVDQDLEIWVDAISSTYDALDEYEFTLPHQWRHLKRSVRYAVGEATSLGLVDLSTTEPAEMVDFNGTWLVFGGDYLHYVARNVGRWRELYSERRARSVEIMDLDAWLARTGRYIRGAGVWPELRGKRYTPRF